MSVITFMADRLKKKFKLQIQKDELSYFGFYELESRLNLDSEYAA